MSSSKKIQEKELLFRMKNGDMLAFDEIFWLYQKAVYGNALKIVRNNQLAEDIVQEVFIRLWEKRESIDIERSVGGWLFVSSYNRAVNELKKKLRESLAIQQMQEKDTEEDAEPDLSGIQLNILEKAIAQLSAQKRRVFELCKLQGRSYEEASREMGISKHTVKEYLSGAVRSIKEYALKYPETGAGLIFLLLIQK